jgi:uncharacterized protein DUF6011
MASTLVAQFTVPGTEATIAITQTAADMFQVVYEAPEELGGSGSYLGEPTEQKAREAANYVWRKIVDYRNHNTAKAEYARRERAQEHEAYREEMRRDANLAAATGTENPRYATVRALRQRAREVLGELAPGHDKFRVAVLLGDDDKLRFFHLDTPLKGKWKGCLFTKEQASDELYKVRDITREEAVLRVVIADAEGALVRYGLELGSCGMCGRTLTDEESRARGVGPVCAEKL